MSGKATFTVIGLVGKVVEFDKSTKVSIASSYPTKEKDEAGKTVYNTDWNSVTVFDDKTREWMSNHVTAGDLVNVDGRMRDSSYQKGNHTIYTTERIVVRFDRLATKEQLDSTRDESGHDQAA